MVFLPFEQQSPISQEESPRGPGEVQQHHQYPMYRHPQEGKTLCQLVGNSVNMELYHLHTEQNRSPINANLCAIRFLLPSLWVTLTAGLFIVMS